MSWSNRERIANSLLSDVFVAVAVVVSSYLRNDDDDSGKRLSKSEFVLLIPCRSICQMLVIFLELISNKLYLSF